MRQNFRKDRKWNENCMFAFVTNPIKMDLCNFDKLLMNKPRNVVW